MAEVKWIKIVTDIFGDEKMLAIECMPDGKDIELIWFKILCLAGKSNDNGFLTINKKIAYTDEMLSKVFRMDIGVIQRALDVFVSLEMIEVVDNAYMISNWLMYQSGDRLEDMKEKHREAQKRYREKQKALEIEDKKESDITRDVTNDITPSYSISNISIYSYSNNSNVNNYIHILDTSEEEYIDYIKRNEILKDVIKSWFNYKDERKPKNSNHYNETSIFSFLKKVVREAKEHGDLKVEGVIEDSISSNYQGVVWDWLDEKSTPQKKKKEKIDWSKV